MRIRLVYVPVAVCTGLFFFSGCMMRELKQDRETAESYKLIKGTVRGENIEQFPVVVALWALDNKARSSYQLADEDSGFRFFTDIGRYHLMAFQDVNMDAVFQAETEPFGMLDDPRIIDVEGPDSFEHLTLTLYPAGRVKIPEEVLEMSAKDRDVRFSKSKAAAGEVTTLDNPLFTPEYAHMGLWSPLTFLSEVNMRLFFLEPYSKDKTPVLFVHGANGTPKDFETLIGGMNRDAFQAWVLFYPSGCDLDELAKTMSQLMEEVHLEYGFDRLVMVAHSMGGLVSRGALIHYGHVKPRAEIPVYITFSTPWNGHSAAEAGVKHAPAVVPAWYDMLPGSSFIRQIQNEALPDETRHYLFFSYKGKGGSPFEKKNTDGAVSIESQLIPAVQLKAGRVLGINADHIGILSDSLSIDYFNRWMQSE